MPFLRGRKWDRWHILLFACLVLGAGLRLVGLTRGTSDFILSEERRGGADEAFYTFHPDEDLVIRTALAPLHPTDPPITTYGMLPSYLLRAVLEVSAVAVDWHPLGLDTPQDRRRVYYTARILAALYSLGVLILVWVLGRRYFGAGTAALALVCATFAAGAIQQAHFYIIDGLFVLLSLATLGAMLRALECGGWRWYAAAGILTGLTGAVRLNGLLLGGVLLAGYLVQEGEERRLRRLLRPDLWLAGGLSVLALLAVEPYLVVNPSRMWRAEVPGDFALALQVVRGEVLQPWLLVDLHTTPYLHHWTHLWPLVAGWPLTLFFAAALVYAVRRADMPRGLMLLWCALYFLMVGGLVAKSVRYIVPLVPFFALFAGSLGAALWHCKVRWRRLAGMGMVALVWGYGMVHGLAFARVYAMEDSRIQAGRWLQAKVPQHRVIAVERGGFSMLPLLGNERYRPQLMEINTLFGVRGYGTCAAVGRYLQERLEPAQFIAISPANRQVQFAAVPELYPTVASFYRHLRAGELGFVQVERFKTYPHFLGMDFKDDGAEPSFLGYDHPAVLIFKKTERFAPDWQMWRAGLERDPLCADGDLSHTAALLRQGDMERALGRLEEVQERYPDLLFAALLEAHIHNLRGDAEAERRSMSPYLAGFSDGSRRTYLLPFAAALSAAELGLSEVSLRALQTGASMPFPDRFKRRMAESYLYVGNFFLDLDDQDSAAEAYRMSAEVFPLARAYEALGNIAHYQGHIDRALDYWEQALSLDPRSNYLGERVGQVAYKYGFYSRALKYLETTLRLDGARVEVRRQLEDAKEKLAAGQ